MVTIEVDAFEYSRLNERRHGELLISQLPRLAKECVDESGAIQWIIAGGLHSSGYPQLIVIVQGNVSLICQRCLKPFSYTVESEAVLVLARNEEQADQIESMLDDDQIDVIAVAPLLDLVQLIEDEVLLSLPEAPKHGECSSGDASEAIESVDTAVKKLSPFAVLKTTQH